MQPKRETVHDHGWGLLDPAEARELLGPLAVELAVGLVVLDRAGRLLFVNAAAARLLLQPAEALLGRDLRELLGDSAGAAARSVEALLRAEPVRLSIAADSGERRVLAAVPQRVHGAEGWLLLALTDVSEEHAAQDRLAQQAAYWAQRNVHLALLQRPTLDFAARPDLGETLQAIAHRSARLIDAEGSAIFLLDEGALRLSAAWGRAADLADLELPADQGLLGELLEVAIPVRFEAVCLHECLRHLGEGPAIAIPLQHRDVISGLLLVLRTPAEPPRLFSEDDELLLAAISSQAALAIGNARLYDATRDSLAQLEAMAGALRRSETRLRAIIDNMPALVYLADPQQGIVLANQPFTELFGYQSSDELLGKRAEDLLIPEEAAQFRQTTEQVYAEGAKIVVEETVTRGGQTRHFLSIKFPVRDAGSGVQQLGGVAVDITERKRNEERLRQLAALEERQNLARELHDSVTQTLFSMSLNARAAERALHNNPQQAAAVVAELRRLAQGALAEMRALIFELRPESLENEGLLAALAKHTAALTARHELPVESETDSEPAIDIAAKEALYRIGQEAMHNVVKHAGASKVALSLRHEQGADGPAFVMRVADDGKGFDPSRRFPGHLGLVSMRERAAKFGGSLTIRSGAGQGTEVVVRMPLPITNSK